MVMITGLRGRLSSTLAAIIVVAGLGFLIWATVTGRINFLAATGQTITLSPASVSVGVGQTFTINVLVSTNNLNTVVASADVRYNPADLSLESISPTGDSTAGTVYQYSIEQSVNTSTGTIRIVRGQPGDGQTNDSDDGFTGQNGTLVVLAFKSLHATTTSITINQSTSSIIADDRQGTNELDSVGNATVSITSSTPPPPPSTGCDTAAVGSNRFIGCLWDGINFNTADGTAPAGPTLSSPVPGSVIALDINWGTSGPNSTVGSDTFSSRWKGTFVFAAGTYTFTAGSDDGLRLRMNGATMIDRWVDRSYTENTFSQTFSSQTTVTIEIDYYENGGNARVNARWASASTSTSPTPPPSTSPTPPPPSPPPTAQGCVPSTSPADYQHAVVRQNAFPTLDWGQAYRFEVTVKNTGRATWCRGTVNLGTDRARDRIPGFIREGDGPSGWLTPNRIVLAHESVVPGQEGTFTFWMRVPRDTTPGTHREYFRLVADGVTWMEDYGIYWDILVPTLADTYHAQYVSQNGYPTLRRGQSYRFEVRFRNSGVRTWQRGVVNLGTDRPRDVVWNWIRQSPDGSPSGWLNDNRVYLVENSVPPGGVGTFRFWYTIPQNKPFGTYRDYFRPVADGVTWMEDWGVYWDVTIVP